MNTTSSKPDSVSMVNITPAAPRSLRTMRCTPADSATIVVGEALVHAVADRAVVVEGGEHLLHLVQHVLDADHVEEGLLLAGEGGVGQVFGGGRGAHREAGLGIASAQGGEGCRAIGLLQVGRERLGLDHGADFGAGRGQGAHVLGVQRRRAWR